MRKGVAATWVVAVLIAWPSALAAQDVTVSGHLGTLGMGADVSVGLAERFAVRAGANIQPWEPSRTFDDVDYTLSLSSPSLTGMLDLYLAGPFRLSGGVVLFGSSTTLSARPVVPVDVGNTTYSPDEIGELHGEFATRDLAPYLGIGLGKAPGGVGVGFTMDLGVAFHGSPDVTLSATGPLASNPAFRTDLDREEQNINEDAERFRVYPVLSFGLAIGF